MFFKIGKCKREKGAHLGKKQEQSREKSLNFESPLEKKYLQRLKYLVFMGTNEKRKGIMAHI